MSDLSPEIILVVDDHRDSRDLMQSLLNADGFDGFTVVTAGNGREALAILYAGLRPCVILMDLMMPVMNAFEFREQQLRDSDLAGIPFIAYSAVVDLPKNAQHLRADAYFEKPIHREAVRRLVRQYCAH